MHYSICCHLWYRWRSTADELSKTDCQQLCNVSGLSSFIGWQACASGLSCPSLSTPIYSLAGSNNVLMWQFCFSSGQHFWITIFHSYGLPCGCSPIIYSHTGFNLSLGWFNTVIKYRMLSVFINNNNATSIFVFLQQYKAHTGRMIFSSSPSAVCLWLLTTKLYCSVMNDHPRQVFIAFCRLHQFVVNRFCQGNVWS